jgi:hypothetical protein
VLSEAAVHDTATLWILDALQSNDGRSLFMSAAFTKQTYQEVIVDSCELWRHVGLHPGVAQHVGRRDALPRVHRQHLLHQPRAAFGHLHN